MDLDFNLVASFLGLLGLIASLYTFLQKQKEIAKQQHTDFERLKFEIEKIQEVTSNDKMQEYYKLQARVEDNTKRIEMLEGTLREEIQKLNEKIDKLILNLNNKQ